MEGFEAMQTHTRKPSLVLDTDKLLTHTHTRTVVTAVLVVIGRQQQQQQHQEENEKQYTACLAISKACKDDL